MVLQSLERSPRLNRPSALRTNLFPHNPRSNALSIAPKSSPASDMSSPDPFCRTPTTKVRKSTLPNMSSSHDTAVGLGICSTNNTLSTSRKRSAPSLLPAFEPLSSPPRLPRPTKRQNRGGYDYPTPAATSSTGILSSSPPGLNAAHLSRALSRIQQPRASVAASTPTSDSASAPDRAPLGDVPSVELPENGDVVRMGRSSISSHFQLSANRLISRVHIEARYITASTPLEPNRVEILCKGWNDVNVHCPGRKYTLHRGDSFTSEEESTQILLDVQDARVIVLWPKRESASTLSEWESSPSPPAHRQQADSLVASDMPELASSPFRAVARLRSPVSPSPTTAHVSSSKLQALLPESRCSPSPEDGTSVQIYEDDPDLPSHSRSLASSLRGMVDPDTTMATIVDSFSSDLSDPEEDDFATHSFDHFEANISSSCSPDISVDSPRSDEAKLGPVLDKPSPESGSSVLAPCTLYAPVQTPVVNTTHTLPSILSLEDLSTATYPSEPHQSPTLSPSPAPEEPVPRAEEIAHHAINQLAFSRLSSTPLSTLLSNLPADIRSDSLTREAFQRVLNSLPSVGIIPRHGKDAAGKPLESEYYYMPENDDDVERKAIVGGMRKPSLRACRKQHKQYYWKRPKTP
ncbi:Protein PLM2 [Ceratocystis lukuohia]|uniref:Protein PLM2 n=1 Tax=Ceratocystis lukuohia TaxID=2019550 RepID=A0ABR4MQ64_9PEZI